MAKAKVKMGAKVYKTRNAAGNAVKVKAPKRTNSGKVTVGARNAPISKGRMNATNSRAMSPRDQFSDALRQSKKSKR